MFAFFTSGTRLISPYSMNERYFQSVTGPTNPNRVVWMSGTNSSEYHFYETGGIDPDDNTNRMHDQMVDTHWKTTLKALSSSGARKIPVYYNRLIIHRLTDITTLQLSSKSYCCRRQLASVPRQRYIILPEQL
jgi:phospholipase C